MAYQSSSSAETKSLGFRAGQKLVRNGVGARARILLLRGDLGSGKTTFVQGLARGLGARSRAQSPTFIIIRRMPLSRKPFRNLFHVDAYRLSSRTNTRALGIRELLDVPENVLAVEWPDAVRSVLPRGALQIRFMHGKRPNERSIAIPKTLQ